MTRATWGSRLGFILAVSGSAVGLANIWRFPYIVGANGGAAFVCLYLLCLIVIGFPVFIAEIVIGRKTATSPSGAFYRLGKSRLWGYAGKLTILTGLIVSSFYSVVAGWILGYFFEALKGNLSFGTTQEAALFYDSLVKLPFWNLFFHFSFLCLCIGVLLFGVRAGIERWNKVLMPFLFIILLILVFWGLSLPNAMNGIKFLLSPDWNELTPQAIMIALGQAFFTLSLGQGTMVTYGSYLNKKENILKSCLPVVFVDTAVSILSALSIFTIVFSVGMEPDSGPGLLFHTLPWVFSHIPGGYFLTLFFFLLVLIAAITSEISAMEPVIAYFVDEWKWTRKMSVCVCGVTAFLLGVPSALSFNVLQGMTLLGYSFFDLVSNLCSSLLIPLGGFFAVILVGWKWGANRAIDELRSGSGDLFIRRNWLESYFTFCFKYAAPVLMLIVFLNTIGRL